MSLVRRALRRSLHRPSVLAVFRHRKTGLNLSLHACLYEMKERALATVVLEYGGCVCVCRHSSFPGVWRCLLAITSGNEQRASEQFYRLFRTFLFFIRRHGQIILRTLLLRLQYLWPMIVRFVSLCCSKCVCCRYKCAYVPIADKYWQLCCYAQSSKS